MGLLAMQWRPSASRCECPTDPIFAYIRHFANSLFQGQTEWGNVIKKYFLNSRGLSLTVADHTPLFVSFNHEEFPGLCLQAK